MGCLSINAKWPINYGPGDRNDGAWGMILAIEAGWFGHDRAGFLGWTKAGRDRFPPEKFERQPDKQQRAEPPSAAEAMAEEIGPKRTSNGGGQLDLF